MVRLKTALLTFSLLCFTGLLAFAVGQLMSVQVKEGHLRSLPSFLGTIVGKLAYGDQVQVYEEKGTWAKVGLTGSSSQGWVHTSALTEKRIVLKPGAEDVEKSASSDELALAGKGFNANVEKEFKAKRTDVNYVWIDKMEKVVVSQAEMQKFLKDGGVSPEGGAK
ncbi:MAG: SH3 domain-containing protein [Pseudomonadota bacterium]